MIDVSFDMKKYDDINLIKDCDLFIDPSGYFYKIKPIKGISILNHNTWSKKYLDNLKYTFNHKFSPAEIMVHLFGFVYYSHDQLKYKPIIKTPNPRYFNVSSSPEQLNSLFNVMMVNGENPFNVPMLMGEENIYDYEEINDNQFQKKRR